MSICLNCVFTPTFQLPYRPFHLLATTTTITLFPTFALLSSITPLCELTFPDEIFVCVPFPLSKLNLKARKKNELRKKLIEPPFFLSLDMQCPLPCSGVLYSFLNFL